MNIIKKALVIATLPVVVLSLAACSTQGAGHVDPGATAAHSTPQPKQSPLIKGFGQVITYTDKVSISVSKPVDFTPSAEAAGEVSHQRDELFTVVITNNSPDVIDLTPFPQVTSGGKASSSITDLGSKSDAGDEPSGKLLPGKSITWNEGFSIADISDIQFQVAPGVDYDTAIFDTDK